MPYVQSLLSTTNAVGTGLGGVVLGAQGQDFCGIQVAGTFSGTLQFEGAVDGVTYTSLSMTAIDGSGDATSTTAVGQWTANIGGLSSVRVRFSAFSSGKALVTVQTETGGTVNFGVTVETATDGALSGDGSSGNKLAVIVDGSTIDVDGSNQLHALGAAVAFKTIAVSGQSSIVADAADDTLTIVAGSNITLTTNAGTDTLTIAASGGGGGTPASPSGSLQWNDSGAFGAVTGSSVNNDLLGGIVGFATLQSTNGFAMTVPAPDLTGLDGPALAGAGAGNLSNGVYSYKVTWLTPNGESLPSVATSTVTVVNHTTNGKVNVTLPNHAQEGVFETGINIYRTVAGGSVYKLAGTSDIYTSTFEDNTADASLGVSPPTTATSIESGYIFSDDGVLTPPLAPAGSGFNGQNVMVLRANGSANSVVIATENTGNDFSQFPLYIQAGTTAITMSGGTVALTDETFNTKLYLGGGHAPDYLTLSGVVTGSGLAVSGLTTPANKPVCFDASGNLYAGTNTGGVLSCP